MDNDSKTSTDVKLKTESVKRINAENSLSDSNEIFSLLVNAVMDYAIFSLDLHGNILTWNTGGARLKGYSADEIIGKHFSIFYTEVDNNRKHPAFELEEAIRTGSYKEEGWRVKKDGSQFWASVVITSLHDNNGVLKGFAKVTRDLSERKKLEDDLKLAYDNLELRVIKRTEELASARNDALMAVRARDEFLSIASHELNTPLTSLKLQAQLRRRQISKGNLAILSPEGFTKMFHDDEKQINRLTRLVDDMLDISRLNSGNFSFDMEEMELNSLVKEVIRRFKDLLEALKIEVSVVESAPIIGTWDRYRIDQVITNLLTNAMKYGDHKPVVIKIESDSRMATLSITDQGIGISLEDQERIFQQYERAVSANMVSGLGLGLYIVKQIISHHDGTIAIESEINQGATFIVKLPLKKP